MIESLKKYLFAWWLCVIIGGAMGMSRAIHVPELTIWSFVAAAVFMWWGIQELYKERYVGTPSRDRRSMHPAWAIVILWAAVFGAYNSVGSLIDKYNAPTPIEIQTKETL